MACDGKVFAPQGSPRGQGPPRMESCIAEWRCLLLEEKVLIDAQRACEEKYLMDIEQDDDAVK